MHGPSPLRQAGQVLADGDGGVRSSHHALLLSLGETADTALKAGTNSLLSSSPRKQVVLSQPVSADPVGHVQAPNVVVPLPLSVPVRSTSVASLAVASTPPTVWHGAVHNAGGADDGRPHVMGQASASNPHPRTRHASHAQDATRTPMQHPTRPAPTALRHACSLVQPRYARAAPPRARISRRSTPRPAGLWWWPRGPVRERQGAGGEAPGGDLTKSRSARPRGYASAGDQFKLQHTLRRATGSQQSQETAGHPARTGRRTGGHTVRAASDSALAQPRGSARCG